MEFDLRNFSLKTLVTVACGILVLISVLHYIVVGSADTRIKETAGAVSLSHQLRSNTYEMLSLINRINSGESDMQVQLKAVVKSHQSQLSSLEFGVGDNLTAPTGEALNTLNLANAQWLPIKINISIFLDDKIQLDSVILSQNSGLIGGTSQAALEMIKMSTNAYQDSLSKLTNSLKQELEYLETRFDNILLLFLFIELLAFTSLLYIIFKFVIGPMLKLALLTEKLSNGENLETRAKSFNNELGDIQKGLNLLIKNIADVTQFVKEIGKGNLDASLQHSEKRAVSKEGLENAVISMRDQMKQVQKDEAERKWATEGLAQFVDILRSTDTDVHELGDKIISKLVDYTNSNQGGIYIITDNEDDPRLELISLYAFSHKKFEQRTIRLGEGLVGQTYLERKTTYLLEIPEDYIDIISGLGGANPKAILIVPLMVNEEIYGILEIASFKEYEAHEIEFIEKLGESIASTISGVKVNQKTKQLLQESQQLTEQMQAQEEEMRQNMEELTATQEEMARTEKQQLAQKYAIAQNIGIAEYDSNGNVTFSNEEYNTQLGYAKDQILEMSMLGLTGKNISDHFKGFLEKQGNTGLIKTFSLFNHVMVEGEMKIVELSLKPDGLDSANYNTDDLEKTLKLQLEALNITQEKLDGQLKTLNTKAKSLATSTNIFILDENTNVIDVSLQAAGTLGRTAEELKTYKMDEIFPGFESIAGSQTLNTKGGNSFKAEVNINKHENGIEYLVHWT